MENNQTGRPMGVFIVWLATFCAAAVVSAELVAALWFRPVDGRGRQALLAAAALALTAVLGFVGQSRARAARRWEAALDAYAEREIARARGRNTEEERSRFFPPVG